jgi:ubiquinone/menaquinone biosynthesis C-methylase UbiE
MSRPESAAQGLTDSEVASTISHACGVMTVVDAALRLGVIARLAEAPSTAAELARDLGFDPHSLAALLRALAALGVLQRDADQSYRAGFTQVDMTRQWSGLEERLRHGTSRTRLDTPDDAAAYYPRSVEALAEAMAAPAAAAAEHLMADAPSAVLDLGAGAAPWSRAIAARSPSCRVLAVDLPPVLEVTRRAARASGVEAQYSFVEGDLFAVDLEEGHYDLCVLGMLCHLFDAPTNRRLLGRARRALRPGGVVAILDALPDGQDPLGASLYELDLLLRTSAGGLHALSDYSGWLREEGFDAPQRLELGAQITLVKARKTPLAP